ncbi:DUF2624 family protein [Legionella sp. D16C41]|uniref:DUF2624 family protein n=1 Tax=Legionella sp. D16C41 TaxID=3402688 RepID=UPI003AF82C20
MPESNQDSCDLLIVGMGPVGLTAAYEAARNGHTVRIIDKRKEAEIALRPQPLVLEPMRKKQLLDMITEFDQLSEKDFKFIDNLLVSPEVKVSSIQKFILRRIEALNKHQKKQGKPPAIILNFYTNLTQVKLKVGEASFEAPKQQSELIDEQPDAGKGGTLTPTLNQTTQTIHFQHLIEADGALAPTLGLLRENSEVKIERETPKDMGYLASDYHFGAYVSIKSKVPFEPPSNEFGASNLNDKLFFARFEHKSYSKSDKKSAKLGFVGEIPKSIYKISDEVARKEAALAYVKRALTRYLKISEDDFVVDLVQSEKTQGAKEKVKMLFFKIDSLQATRAFESHMGHYFCLLGDAYFTPNYHVAHGLNDGIESAKELAQLPKDSDNVEEHMLKCEKLLIKNAKEARKQMISIRYLRMLPHLGIKILTHQIEQVVETREKENKLSVNPIKGDVISSTYISKRCLNIIASPLNLIQKGSPNYTVGFISAKALKDPLDIAELNKLFKDNDGVPFTIRKVEDEQIKYYIFVRNSSGEGKLIEKELDDAHITHLYGKSIDELFSQNFITLDKDNYPLREHYTFLSENEIEQLFSQVTTLYEFLDNYPNLVWQFKLEITGQLYAIQKWLNENKKVIEKYSNQYDVDIAAEINKIKTFFISTLAETTASYSASDAQTVLNAAITLKVPTVAQSLVLCGVNPFVAEKSNLVEQSLFNLSFLEPDDSNYLAAYADSRFTLHYLLLAAGPKHILDKPARGNLTIDIIEKLMIFIHKDKVFINLTSKELLALAKQYQLDIKSEQDRDIKVYLKSYLINYLEKVKAEALTTQIKSFAKANQGKEIITLLSRLNEHETLAESNKYYKLQGLMNALFYSLLNPKSCSECINLCGANLLDFLLKRDDSYYDLTKNDFCLHHELREKASELINEPRFAANRKTLLKKLSKQLLLKLQEPTNTIDDLINIYNLAKKLNLFKNDKELGFFSLKASSGRHDKLLESLQQHVFDKVKEDNKENKLIEQIFDLFDQDDYTQTIREILDFSIYPQDKPSKWEKELRNIAFDEYHTQDLSINQL